MLRNKSYHKAQGMVEYALILILVSLVIIVALVFFGPVVGQIYSDIISSL